MSEISVEQFVRDLVTLSGVYTVDDDGYVFNKKDTEEPVLIKDGSVYKQLMVIKDKMTDNDAIIINPLNENISESTDSKWLYITMSAGLGRRILEIARFLKIVIETEATKEAESYFSPEVLSFAAKHKGFDAKTLDFLELVAKQKLNFVSVWYNRKMKEARFRCSVYDPDTPSEFPQVTKKAWKIITNLMSDILGVSDDVTEAAAQIVEKYSFTSELITVPKLESILNVYMKLYSRLNKFLQMCEMGDPDFVVDLTTLGHHIENIDKYYKKAKWFTSSSIASPSSKPSIRTIEGTTEEPQSTLTGGIPSNPAVCHPGMITYTEPQSNIPSNPLRSGMGFGGYQQHQMMQPQQMMFQQPQQIFQQGGFVPIQQQPMGGCYVPIR